MSNAKWHKDHESLIREVFVEQHAIARAAGQNERAQLLASCFDDRDIENACGYAIHSLRLNMRALVEAKVGPSLTSVIYKPRRQRRYARAA